MRKLICTICPSVQRNSVFRNSLFLILRRLQRRPPHGLRHCLTEAPRVPTDALAEALSR